MTDKLTRLKYVAQFGYGDQLLNEESFDDDVKVFGSNGPYARTSIANTKAPVIIVGRKGSYGKVNWSSEPCFASDTTFFVDETKTKHNLRWLYYTLQSLRLDEGSNEAAVPGLNRETAYNQQFPVFDSDYQESIADYLDRETTRLDNLIQAKEAMLTLLAEKRQALITQAVTRGLDSTVGLKPSGVEWLGDVPEHWEVIRLKFLGNIYYGLGQPPEYQPTGLPLIRATNVFRGIIKVEGMVYVNEGDLPESKKVILQTGDIIVVRSGAYTADSALVTDKWEGAVAGFDMVFRANSKVNPKFLAQALLSPYVLDSQLIPMSVRAAQPHLNAEELGDVIITLPSVEEQSSIIDQLSKDVFKINALQTAAERTITLLKERRSALITAAVTGQIDIPVANQTDALAGQVWEQKGYTDADMDRLLNTHVRTPYKKR